jgi:hypothetical protein
MQPEAIDILSANVRGRVITPDSSEYEVARQVYNGMINRRPIAIVYCANEVDVTAAVNFARQERLTLAIAVAAITGRDSVFVMTDSCLTFPR